MKKNRINELNVLQSADNNRQKSLSRNIPVFLVLGLCLLSVSIFSNQSYLFHEDSSSAEEDITEKYIWITGSSKAEDGLYRLTLEQLEETFPELLPLVSLKATLPESDSEISAIQYESDVPQPINLPPAVANIFFKPISINRAGTEILSTLPGIGPMLAEKIVRRREVKGPYKSKDELLHISGIGPQKLAKLIGFIILD